MVWLKENPTPPPGGEARGCGGAPKTKKLHAGQNEGRRSGRVGCDLLTFTLTWMVTMRGNGWRVLAPPSMAMPRVLALLATLTSVDVGSNRPGYMTGGWDGSVQDWKDTAFQKVHLAVLIIKPIFVPHTVNSQADNGFNLIWAVSTPAAVFKLPPFTTHLWKPPQFYLRSLPERIHCNHSNVTANQSCFVGNNFKRH